MESIQKPLVLEDLMAMEAKALHEVMCQGHALEPEELSGRMYLGVDLSMPQFMRKLLWHTFRKTFVHDESSGVLRGWNVRMEQHGVDGERIPLQDRHGKPVTFGHYQLRSAEGIDFPKDLKCPNFLDYTRAGNSTFDLARFGYTPLVAVNEGSQDLLLGWEVFKLGPGFLPLPLYWALRYEGVLEEVIEPPRRPKY